MLTLLVGVTVVFSLIGHAQPAVQQQTHNPSRSNLGVNVIAGQAEIVIVFQHSYRKHNKDFGLAIMVDGNIAGYVRTGGIETVAVGNGTRTVTLRWAEYKKNQWKLDKNQKTLQVNCNNDATIVTITAKSFMVKDLNNLDYDIAKFDKGFMAPKPGESVVLVKTKWNASAIIVGLGIQTLWNKLHIYIDGVGVPYEKTKDGAEVKVQNGFHLITIVDDGILSNVVPLTANSNRISFLARRGAFKTWELDQTNIEVVPQGNQLIQSQTGIIQTSSQNKPSQYFVVLGGQQSGPYSIDDLKVLLQQGRLQRNSLVWKEGMQQWVAAGSVDELADIFGSAPPPLPPPLPR